jgi:hypothetical protein
MYIFGGTINTQRLFKFVSVISLLCVRPVVTSQRRVSSTQQMVKSRKGKEVTGGLSLRK